MPTCIYCRCSGQEFDREHVIPEAFGMFEPVSFILYDAVCKDCNNYFGRTLDFALSRDSTEAMLRFRYGTKPAKEAGDLPYKKLELKIGQPGPWLGATVVLETDRAGKAVEPVPVPQAAFRWKGSQDWTYLVERELEPYRLQRGSKEHGVEPVYPLLAKQIGRSGKVELRAIIATDGRGHHFNIEDRTIEPLFSSPLLAPLFR